MIKIKEDLNKKEEILEDMPDSLTFARLNFDIKDDKDKKMEEIIANRKKLLLKLINFDTDLYSIFSSAKSRTIFNDYIGFAYKIGLSIKWAVLSIKYRKLSLCYFSF